MNEPIPFTLEKWKELEPKGARISLRNSMERLRFIGYTRAGEVVTENDGGVLSADSVGVFHILPPRQVIEFKVGLFKDGQGGFLHVMGEFNFLETANNFIRLLTKEEMRDGVVEI